MKNRIVTTLLATTMSVAMVAGNLTPSVYAQDTETKGTKIVPVPKKMATTGQELQISDSVNIEGTKTADADAVKELKEFLQENEIQINETAKEQDTTIILGEAGDDLKALIDAKERLNMESADKLGEEGYVMAVDRDDLAGGTIVIEGKSGDGTFYGVQTLKQLTEKTSESVTVAEVVIKDEPTMTVRGSIEGFYGTPWSHKDRLSQIEFYGDQKLNTYIYAPKDDRYHREQWREPYPTTEMKRMQELIDTSKANKVDFVFSLSPGIDIRFDGAAGEADYQALVKKCQSLYDMGVRSFAIFFDDIDNKDGKKQAEVLNRFNKEFIQAKGDIKPLITVPTEYDSNAMKILSGSTQYTKDFASTLDKSIKVLWTGSAVVPEGIDVANAQQVKSVYGDRMGIWWNYPCTDYIKNKLGLGPVYGLDKGLEHEVDFLVMNPMEHAELSKISLATGADYAWNTAAYDYEKSFKAAIDELYGELAPYMYTFANHSTRLVAGWASTGRADAPAVRELMNTTMKKIARGEDAAKEIAALNQEFDQMVLAADTLKAKLPGEELSHCSGNLDKLKALGESDKVALELFVEKNADNRNEEKVQNLTAQLNQKMNALRGGKLVSEQTALAFIKEVLDYSIEPNAAFKVSDTFVAPGEEIQLSNASSLSSTELEWSMPGANIKTSTEENPKISYKKEGVYTITLKAKNRNGESSEIVKQDFITVSKDAKKEEVNLALNKKATASGQTGSAESPDKAIDGIINTKWCTTNRGNQWMQIDLGKVSTLTEIVINHAEMGGEGSSLNTAAYHVEVSEDGQNYKEVLRVGKNTAGLTEDPIAVTHGRYVKLWIDEPTQGGDNAARIYEVEVKGLEEAVAIPPVYDPSKEVSTETLEATLKAAENADVKGALESAKARFEEAVKAAKAILAKVEAGDEEVTQEMANAANQELLDAMKGLEIKQGDKTELNKVIAEAEKLNKEDYEEEGFVEMQKALKAAKEMAANGDATQKMVDAAKQELLDAVNGLEIKQGDKTELNKAIAEAEKLNKEDYEEEGFVEMQKALKAAKEMAANEAATQKMVDASLKNLREAIDKLVPAKSNDNENENPQPKPEKGDSQQKPVKTGDQTATTASLLGVLFAAILVVIAKFRKEKNV